MCNGIAPYAVPEAKDILILFKKAKSLFIAPEARSGSHGTVCRALRGISVRSTRILKLIISI